ncbi:MAG: hypothetical protein WBD72_04495, partial [Candidatus Acidiferrum sp.]
YAQSALSANALMEHMAIHLHEKMTRYNWTGFYLVDPADSSFLIVGPYAGSFTPNARIPLDRVSRLLKCNRRGQRRAI